MVTYVKRKKLPLNQYAVTVWAGEGAFDGNDTITVQVVSDLDAKAFAERLLKSIDRLE